MDYEDIKCFFTFHDVTDNSNSHKRKRQNAWLKTAEAFKMKRP